MTGVEPLEDHPARYGRPILEAIGAALPIATYPRVLDPFAGAGGIHALAAYGWDTVGVEIEPEWAACHPSTRCASATDLPFGDATFDAVATSPCYGNRFADAYRGQRDRCKRCVGVGRLERFDDGCLVPVHTGVNPAQTTVPCPDCEGSGLKPSMRRGYAVSLQRDPSPGSAAAMQWGPEYRRLHLAAWREAVRVLRPGGRFVLNIKDHARQGRRQCVAAWHVEALLSLGLRLRWCQDIDTGGYRLSPNRERYPEQLWVFDAPDGML